MTDLEKKLAEIEANNKAFRHYTKLNQGINADLDSAGPVVDKLLSALRRVVEQRTNYAEVWYADFPGLNQKEKIHKFTMQEKNDDAEILALLEGNDQCGK